MLTFTEFSGSPYHIGLALGKFGAAPVHDTLTTSALWKNVMHWRGSEQVQAMQHLVQQQHPYIWDELQGLARGLELPPEDVFVWNCRGDLSPLTADTGNADAGSIDTVTADDVTEHTAGEFNADGYTPDESTTIMTITPQGPRIVHNNVIDPQFASHCSVAEFIVDHGPEFASFIYPGSIPGHTFAVTGKGMAITVNAVRPDESAAGIPCIVLARALLNTSDLSSAVQLLNDSPRSGGMHLSLAQRGGAALLSVEFNATKVSIQPVRTAMLHTNHLIHDAMQEQPQTITESSHHRLSDGTDMLCAPEEPDPLRILVAPSSDARPDDRNNTPDSSQANNMQAVADIHIGADAVYWDIYEHPGEPARFRMHDAKHV